MWWSETLPGRRSRALLLALPLALSAGGCLQPLYGEAAHPGLVAEMRAIAVDVFEAPTRAGGPGYTSLSEAEAANPNTSDHSELSGDVRFRVNAPAKDRFGHYLGNDLITDFNGTGETPEPKFRLTVTTSLVSSTPTVSSQVQEANASTLTAIAKYRLTAVGGGAPILEGSAVRSAVFDISINRFSNLRAQRDAEIRLAKSLADEMELRIAAKLGETK